MVRAVPFMGAITAIRHNPPRKAFRNRLLATGKPRLVALIAVVRKLLTILNAIIRNSQRWRAQSA